MPRHTHRGAARAVGASIGALATLVGATVGPATPVSASADGCDHPQNFDACMATTRSAGGYFIRQGVHGTTIPINATFGDGTQVCSYRWKYNGGADYSGPYGPACVTVHR